MSEENYEVVCALMADIFHDWLRKHKQPE